MLGRLVLSLLLAGSTLAAPVTVAGARPVDGRFTLTDLTMRLQQPLTPVAVADVPGGLQISASDAKWASSAAWSGSSGDYSASRTISASFTYSITTADPAPADGFAWVIQSAGPGSLGSNGSSVGYYTIDKSIAVAFRSYAGIGYEYGLDGDWTGTIVGCVAERIAGTHAVSITLKRKHVDSTSGTLSVGLDGRPTVLAREVPWPAHGWAGFTAGTGLYAETTVIRNFTMTWY